jgi:hypothetical protein
MASAAAERPTVTSSHLIAIQPIIVSFFCKRPDKSLSKTRMSDPWGPIECPELRVRLVSRDTVPRGRAENEMKTAHLVSQEPGTVHLSDRLLHAFYQALQTPRRTQVNRLVIRTPD